MNDISIGRGNLLSIVKTVGHHPPIAKSQGGDEALSKLILRQRKANRTENLVWLTNCAKSIVTLEGG